MASPSRFDTRRCRGCCFGRVELVTTAVREEVLLMIFFVAPVSSVLPVPDRAPQICALSVSVMCALEDSVNLQMSLEWTLVEWMDEHDLPLVSSLRRAI